MDVPVVYLATGEMVVATQPCEVRTILGSCVGVALHDPRNQWGGVCHYLLARDIDRPGVKGGSTLFGEVALRALVTRLVRAGSNRWDLVAHVAGGALLLDANEVLFVGENNIALAESLLGQWGIPIVQQATGGDRGRKMSFLTREGSCSIQNIGNADPDSPHF